MTESDVPAPRRRRGITMRVMEGPPMTAEGLRAGIEGVVRLLRAVDARDQAARAAAEDEQTAPDASASAKHAPLHGSTLPTTSRRHRT